MLYLIAATINGKEYLIIEPNFDIITYTDLQTAKNQFRHIYHLITNEAKNSIPFQKAVKLLITAQPTILKKEAKLSEIALTVLEASTKEATMRSNIPIIIRPHILLPLKPGFINKHEVLNIQRDIEASPCIGPNGEITYQMFNSDPTISAEARVAKFRQQHGLN
ncbi:hypothetical protein [Chitinophaga rhizophila]|uniref:Uncharacterized protein n=1 Tax=Chitinophaga rhizophila TaxID=2866212 RepID=A0ABS7GHV5_9BACT|nr:hypothetical protein [Chitinophaga rhizophila]MBW8687274.1 hypothetical protein [Chitinophaga rhizophila]